MLKCYIEVVIEKIGPHITQSKLRVPTEKEYKQAVAEYKSGNCKHNLIIDIAGPIYDERICALCKKHVDYI